MEDDLDEREMNVLRQKALSTLRPKLKKKVDMTTERSSCPWQWQSHRRKFYREKQGSDFGVGPLDHDNRGGSIDKHPYYQPHASAREPRRMRDSSSRGRSGGVITAHREHGRARRASSSRSTSRSHSESRSYSSYSTSASSTSGSRSRSSSSGSRSSYSSYTRSSYSSSRRSYSASPHSSRIRKEHALLQKGSHSDPRSKPLSSKVPSHRRYPPSSQWYEAHPPPSYTSSRSPLRTRKVYPPPPHPTSRSSRVYNDEYPPAKRRPPTDYPEYRRGPPPSGRHHRIHSPPPPPPPPALKRKERVVRRMRRSPLRSPPHSSRLAYGRGPPSPPPRRRPRRHSFSPPPPPRPTRAPRPSRGLVSDHIPSRPSSRDFRSLCGPPIHVREHLRRRTPERRGPRPSDPSSARSSYKPASTGLSRSRWMERDRQREGRPLVRSRVGSVSDRARRSITESSRKEKLERATDKSYDKEKTSADEQGNSSTPPSLTSPTTAQLLWEEEEEVGGGEDGCVKVEEGEEGEVEELDYDETMEDLDLHPTGNIDEAEGDEARRHSVTSDARPGTVSWDDSEGEVQETEETGQSPSVHSDQLIDAEPGSNAEPDSNVQAPEEGDAVSSASVDENDVHISSPIRVSPDRREPRVVRRSPRQGKNESRLSAKERLYVSKNAIEEKKWKMSRRSEDTSSKLRRSEDTSSKLRRSEDTSSKLRRSENTSSKLRRSEDTSSKLPRSLANRLGPSPGLHGRVGRRSDRSSGSHKGSALAIAAEYKRRRQAAELSPREAARATRMTKRINKDEYKPTKHRKPEERSEENERKLDKKIDSIKEMNKALAKRHKEIEKDKQLYG